MVVVKLVLTRQMISYLRSIYLDFQLWSVMICEIAVTIRLFIAKYGGSFAMLWHFSNDLQLIIQ